MSPPNTIEDISGTLTNGTNGKSTERVPFTAVASSIDPEAGGYVPDDHPDLNP